jgi:hypothetical protein
MRVLCELRTESLPIIKVSFTTPPDTHFIYSYTNIFQDRCYTFRRYPRHPQGSQNQDLKLTTNPINKYLILYYSTFAANVNHVGFHKQ